MSEYTYITRTCNHCGKTEILGVDAAAYTAWRSGQLIQDAFPDLTPEVREQIMTGYHSACFDLAMGEE
jgi:hypothetical protein